MVTTRMILQAHLGLPEDAEKLHFSIDIVDDRFSIKEIRITKYLERHPCIKQAHATYSFDRYVRSIKEIKNNLKKQHALIASIKTFVVQYLDSLNMLDIQDGAEFELDELEVA